MKEQKRVGLDWIIVVVALIVNILWYFIPLAGETAFMALWDGASPWLAIPLSLVATGFFIGRLVICRGVIFVNVIKNQLKS